MLYGLIILLTIIGALVAAFLKVLGEVKAIYKLSSRRWKDDI